MTGRLEKKLAVTIFVDVKSAQCDQSLIGLEVINPSEKQTCKKSEYLQFNMVKAMLFVSLQPWKSPIAIIKKQSALSHRDHSLSSVSANFVQQFIL